jgi:FtsH-binding integral membrane protein
MSYGENPYAIGLGDIVARTSEDERADFITKTYLHLAGAVAAFVALEAILLNMPGVENMVGLMVASRFGWLIVLGAFILVSNVANRWALSATSLATQYLGLALYVVAEAIVFVPLLYVAVNFGGENLLPAAALLTGTLFVGLTAVVLLTRRDFSFLRTALMFGGFAALGLIVVSILFQFDLGVIFTGAMIALACGYILYDTSNVLHHYRVGQHVAASLALFASVALLFWYILRLLMSLRRD